MIDKTHQLSVRQQSQLIQINRSTLYYKPKEISSTDLSWMRLIDEIHLDYPDGDISLCHHQPCNEQLV